MELQDRVALVTGGGTGLGREVSLELARRGAHVAVVYSRSENEANATVEELRSLGVGADAFHADVSRGEGCRRLAALTLDRFGRLDILINNAGTTKFVPFQDLEGVSDDEWDRIQDVNVKGPWMLARACAPALKERNGSIVNVASVAGLQPGGSSLAYAVSKAAMIHLTGCLAVAMAPHVRVNCVAPGLFITRWTAGFPEERLQAMKERALLKKAVDITDLARATVELAANASMTGSTIVVDGGLSLA